MDHVTTPHDDGSLRARRRQQLARTVLTIAFAALGLFVVASFLRPILWGGIIAIAVAPLVARAERRMPGRPTLLAAGFTLAIALLVVVPLVLGIVQAALEAHQLTDWLVTVRHDGIALPAAADKLPIGREAFANWWNANLATPDAASDALHKVNMAAREHSRLFGAGLLRRGVVFTFALLTLFFLLRDRVTIAVQARTAGERLFGASGELVAEQILLSVRGTINGLILVGIGEGVVMALVYLAAGVPH
ncbi:MAG: AI-2E family transporter, partial [Janthinobacterium lividum]